MCATNVETVHNVASLCITNNLLLSFGGALVIVKRFYPKLQAATIILV